MGGVVRRRAIAVGWGVMLKSGGPSMVVAAIRGRTATCQWWVSEAEKVEMDFPVATLAVIWRV